MMEIASSADHLVDVVLWIWFVLTAVCVAYVAYDQFKGEPPQNRNSLAMKTMRWGWVLVTLYTGPFGLIVYWFLHSESAHGRPEQSTPPLWEQSVESTIHCVAGDATGILLVAVIMGWLRLPLTLEVITEYVAGFAVGLFVFQALPMKTTFGGNYWRAVQGTLLPEGLSMNTVMAGMVPVMVIMMSRDVQAMEPTSVRFWGTMSLAFVVSTLTAFPVNWWLVKRGLKHGMGGEERAHLRHCVSAASKLTVMALTLAMLAVGIILAARFGDYPAMRASASRSMEMLP